MPPKKTVKTTTGKPKVGKALIVSGDEKATCEKRGGTWYPPTATHPTGICIVIPKEPNDTIQINRFRGEPCLVPVGPRDPYILVPPTREVALALINAIKR
jgi:hypothetical protein